MGLGCLGTHVTELTCETWDLALCCISSRSKVLKPLHTRLDFGTKSIHT